MMKTIREFLEEQINGQLIQAVLSQNRNKDEIIKVKIRPVEQKGKVYYQASATDGKKVFHTNYGREEVIIYIEESLQDSFRQLQVQGMYKDGSVLVSKKGKATVKERVHESVKPVKVMAHNRIKNYILKEGVPVPFLEDLGVMNKEGKVIAAKYDKFKQINRFLEFIEDVLPKLPREREITILDFGCGKSYLTFAVYYYLKEIKRLDVTIIGLDLKEDVINKCNILAQKYGYSKLHFYQGDIADYQGVCTVDMVITLHACDTATDFALWKAVKWGAGVILSVPCCQHELNRQIKNELLAPVLKYGILKERMSALLTDGIRAEILRAWGYEVQILEFIDMEHTPKNLLIRAVKTGNRKSMESLKKLIDELGVNPTLLRLLDRTDEVPQEKGE